MFTEEDKNRLNALAIELHNDGIGLTASDDPEVETDPRVEEAMGLISKYANTMLSSGTLWISDTHIREEVAQEACRRTISSFKGFDPEKCAFTSSIYGNCRWARGDQYNYIQQKRHTLESGEKPVSMSSREGKQWANASVSRANSPALIAANKDDLKRLEEHFLGEDSPLNERQQLAFQRLATGEIPFDVAKEVAQHSDCAERTVYRDIEKIRELANELMPNNPDSQITR